MTVKRVVYPEDFEALSAFFKGKSGHRRAEYIMKLLAIDKVNQVYDNSGDYTGAEFTSRLLDDLGVNYTVGNAERLRQLPEGPFITVSNHPYGGLDGIMTIDLMASIRPDYKFMVNRLISLVRTLQGNFISVIPTGNKKTGITGTNLRAIRDTLEHLRSGHPVGFFPSGAVSDYNLKERRIRDRRWQASILNVIHSVKVPVLPLRFFDRNSAFFYFLGLINWRIRALRLPSEVFNKRGREVRIGVGNIIRVEDQKQFPDPETFGAFLRKTVYEMPLPESFIPRKMINLGRIS